MQYSNCGLTSDLHNLSVIFVSLVSGVNPNFEMEGSWGVAKYYYIV